MAISADEAVPRGAMRDHRFHQLRVKRVVPETAEASSLVLDVPADLREAFAYRAGQFLTFRVRIDDHAVLRCYSMSSSPEVDPDLQVTVKRVPGGAVSNWMIDNLAPGDVVEATCPAGVFSLPPGEGDVVAFSAGSGITPVISIAKTALATTRRRVRLLYANRDRGTIIFAAALDSLRERYPERFEVVHHLDVERGFVDAGAVHAAAHAGPDADYFICGPGPFMDLVEAALLDDVPPGRVQIERFTPGEPGFTPGEPLPAPIVPAEAGRSRVTVELDGRTETADHHPGTTVLQMARQMGLAPPFSCESGSCATCMARLVEGEVTMYVNNALTADEVADGWVLTCQALPTTPSVRVVYGDEGG